jgi:hypothetical protein
MIFLEKAEYCRSNRTGLCDIADLLHTDTAYLHPEELGLSLEV